MTGAYRRCIDFEVSWKLMGFVSLAPLSHPYTPALAVKELVYDRGSYPLAPGLSLSPSC